MSWNIKTPGDYINGPLTVVGATTLNNTLTVSGVSVFNTNVGIGTATPNSNSNRSTLTLQGAWGGQIDINVGAINHAQFGSDNFSSGLSCRIQSADGIAFKVNGGSILAGRFDTAGNFGVAVTPSAWGAANKAIQVSGASLFSDSVLEARLGNNCYYDGTNWKYIYGSSAAATNYRQVTGNHIWYAAPAGTGTIASFPARMTLSNDGTLELHSENLKVAAGKGIDFSNSSNATGMTSELLNDYEEGTFTPTVTSVGGTGIVYTPNASDSGRYTKIGRSVFFQVRLAGTYTGSFSYIRVALPFAATNSNPDGVVSGYNNDLGTNLVGRTDFGSSFFIVGNIQGSGAAAMFSGFITV